MLDKMDKWGRLELKPCSTILVAAASLAISERRGEIRGEIRVHRDHFGDVAVEFLDEGHVVHHVTWNSRLVVLIHLLNQDSVSVQHRLDLPESLVKGGPNLGVAFVGEAAVVAGGGGRRRRGRRLGFRFPAGVVIGHLGLSL